jgi:hypothetical protein
MRLLNTSSLQLEEFPGTETPHYAILSHTWEMEEILFSDMQGGTAESKAGFAKVKGCCQKALDDGFEWVWIDTCCIDKSSSAELSEAINSMYAWYRDSVVCYAYLQDVTELDAADPNLLSMNEFGKSRWFTRGWTLQELIAPPGVEFYTLEWVEIGTKLSLAPALSLVTGIPTPVFHGRPPKNYCVAQRMSWAATRQTTRVEDVAYCLLGIFDVHMPLLYGEGRKSFYRLQYEILSQEEDYSLFAFGRDYHGREGLASSPTSFGSNSSVLRKTVEAVHALAEDMASYVRQPWIWSREAGPAEYSGMVAQTPRQSGYSDIEPPQVTSRGIRLKMPLLSLTSGSDETEVCLAWVYCAEPAKSAGICILLAREGSEDSYRSVGHPLIRWSIDKLWRFEPTEIYLKASTVQERCLFSAYTCFFLRLSPRLHMAGSWPTNDWWTGGAIYRFPTQLSDSWSTLFLNFGHDDVGFPAPLCVVIWRSKTGSSLAMCEPNRMIGALPHLAGNDKDMALVEHIASHDWNTVWIPKTLREFSKVRQLLENAYRQMMDGRLALGSNFADRSVCKVSYGGRGDQLVLAASIRRPTREASNLEFGATHEVVLETYTKSTIHCAPKWVSVLLPTSTELDFGVRVARAERD